MAYRLPAGVEHWVLEGAELGRQVGGVEGVGAEMVVASAAGTGVHQRRTRQEAARLCSFGHP